MIVLNELNQSRQSLNKGGRPRKEIDPNVFEGLCSIQCTLSEIAGVLRVSEDTVERWCERTYEVGFADTYKKHSAEGKSSLRRKQFEVAKKGNVTMLIWLGKQYLGQKDRAEHQKDDAFEVEEMSEEARGERLWALLSRARARQSVNNASPV